MGLCSKGPLIRMTSKTQKDVLFSDIKPEMAATVVDQVVAPGAWRRSKSSSPAAIWKSTRWI